MSSTRVFHASTLVSLPGPGGSVKPLLLEYNKMTGASNFGPIMQKCVEFNGVRTDLSNVLLPERKTKQYDAWVNAAKRFGLNLLMKPGTSLGGPSALEYWRDGEPRTCLQDHVPGGKVMVHPAIMLAVGTRLSKRLRPGYNKEVFIEGIRKYLYDWATGKLTGGYITNEALKFTYHVDALNTELAKQMVGYKALGWTETFTESAKKAQRHNQSVAPAQAELGEGPSKTYYRTTAVAQTPVEATPAPVSGMSDITHNALMCLPGAPVTTIPQVDTLTPALERLEKMIVTLKDTVLTLIDKHDLQLAELKKATEQNATTATICTVQVGHLKEIAIKMSNTCTTTLTQIKEAVAEALKVSSETRTAPETVRALSEIDPSLPARDMPDGQ